MRTLLLAAPFEDFARDNASALAIVIVVVLAILVARLIQRAAMRMALFAILGAVTIFVLVERDEIQRCAQDCECELAGVDTDVPFCDREILETP